MFGDTKTLATPARDSEVRMKITLNGQYKRTKFYNVAKHLEHHVMPILDDLEERGVIRRCLRGAYCAPMLVVLKKNGKPRPVMDYRDLNFVTEPYHYPLPQIDNIKQDLRGRIFSVLDFTDAFHQVLVDPDDIQKTAVQTPKGLYEFVRMPFGLKNAPTVLQMFIEIVLDPLRAFAIGYIDNILIHSNSYEERLEHLRLLFERLQEYGLVLNLAKSKFFQTTI